MQSKYKMTRVHLSIRLETEYFQEWRRRCKKWVEHLISSRRSSHFCVWERVNQKVWNNCARVRLPSFVFLKQLYTYTTLILFSPFVCSDSSFNVFGFFVCLCFCSHRPSRCCRLPSSGFQLSLSASVWYQFSALKLFPAQFTLARVQWRLCPSEPFGGMKIHSYWLYFVCFEWVCLSKKIAFDYLKERERFVESDVWSAFANLKSRFRKKVNDDGGRHWILEAAGRRSLRSQTVEGESLRLRGGQKTVQPVGRRRSELEEGEGNFY